VRRHGFVLEVVEEDVGLVVEEVGVVEEFLDGGVGVDDDEGGAWVGAGVPQ
jgi:hypothetical protein